ncbi:hypothetical protein ACBJ59_32125 [Nonomuraea sp. MTCD27]|uniref:hypothetical protein n=1 Tax=Nonomuraea sp. MTCD27 TaxID=1676747 RepID=UPI0035BFB947
MRERINRRTAALVAGVAVALSGTTVAGVAVASSAAAAPASGTPASSRARPYSRRAAPAPPPGNPTGLVGWATQGGGTSGGGGASPVTVTSASALTSALSSGSAAVIRVSGTISCSGMLRVASNKTVLGNSGATISGCGFNISEAANVIVRNLTFRGWNDGSPSDGHSPRPLRHPPPEGPRRERAGPGTVAS